MSGGHRSDNITPNRVCAWSRKARRKAAGIAAPGGATAPPWRVFGSDGPPETRTKPEAAPGAALRPARGLDVRALIG
jgi:hypothetical protein